MKRNVEPEFEFQKEEFIKLWKKAIGDRSYSLFGKEAGISFGYISKYMNGKCDVSPTIQTLKKISKVAIGVTYAELLEAAGYDADVHDEATVFFQGDQVEGTSIANKLLASLYNVSFKWQFENPVGNQGEPISLRVDEAPFKKWYFIPVSKDVVKKEDISSVLGSKEAEKISQGEKVSFITSNMSVYNEIKMMELNLLSLRISIMYVNTDEIQISKEEYLKTAIELTDEDKLFVITNKETGEKNPLSL